jgi:hypothetical protein
VLRTVVAPLVAAYGLLAAVTFSAWRRPRPPSAPATDAGVAGLVRHVLVTTGGGFLAFLGLVAVFHVWLAGQPAAFSDALVGGGFLAMCAAVAFILLSTVERRLRRSSGARLGGRRGRYSRAH